MFDLCVEIIKAMKKLQYTEAEIEIITSHPSFIKAEGKTPQVQRVELIMTFFDIIVLRMTDVPDEIRVALNIAQEPIDWLEDMSNTVLPFIKWNFDKIAS